MNLLNPGAPVWHGLRVCGDALVPCRDADSVSGQIGTWKLNEAKSKLNPASTKNPTVVYEAAGDSVKVTVEGTTSDGKAFKSAWTGKYDAKDYPVTGDPPV